MDYNYNKYYDRWNRYELGNVHFTKEHLSKLKFINYIISSDIKNILEIGAGEVMEAQEIRKYKDVNYTVLDISDTFLENAKLLGFNTVKGEMHNTGFDDKQFDLIYLCSVLEHTPNIRKTLEELKRISKLFYFIMFKWKQKSGGLESVYRLKGNYFSTSFNINKLLEMIKVCGQIKELHVCTKKNRCIEYSEYLKQIRSIDEHRNGNYLSVIGEF